MQFRPDVAIALNQLAQVLLADEASLSKRDRELIASFVSSRNDCTFCMTSHGAIAAHLPEGNHELVEAIWKDYKTAPIDDKLKSLLHIADVYKRQVLYHRRHLWDLHHLSGRIPTFQESK